MLLKKIEKFAERSKLTEKANKELIDNFIEVKEHVELKLNLDNKYLMDYSIGEGRKAHVPWITIFDKEVTNTAQKGIYVVILFNKELNKFYLSLNQGYFYYKEYIKVTPQKNARLVSKKLYDMLENKRNFNREIDLCSTADTPRGYEAAHILGKEYVLDEKFNENELYQDIDSILKLYSEIKYKIKNDINSFIFNTIEMEGLEEGLDTLKEIKEGKKEISFTNVDIAEIKPKKRIEKEIKARKVNFEEISKKKVFIGKIGEEAIYNEEKEKVIKLFGEEKAKECVIHTSLKKGDGAGYDIESIDEEGEIIYLEIKTTTSNDPMNIFITQNEIKKSRELGDRYRLIIIYDLDLKNSAAKRIELKGSIENSLNLEPVVYRGVGIK